ncbi:MAG: hypothetical protein IJX66_06645 [Lachnospiraceae bacterium]|nr:hypothetical protein [Lachnospiraceae bacterium]
MIRRCVKMVAALSIIATMLVGCGKTEQTGITNETGAVESTMTENTAVAGNGEETATPTADPTETPIETEMPTEEPASVPTEEPAPEITEEPTSAPAEAPTPEPVAEPTPTPEPVHEHSYSSTVLQEATCSTAGTKLFTCSCGHSYEEQYYGECVSDGNRIVTHEPTCSSEGASGEHCIYCGVRMYGRSIPKTEHTPNSYWSCYTPTGDYYLSCSICSHVITHTTTRPEGVEIREYSDVDSSTLQPIN